MIHVQVKKPFRTTGRIRLVRRAALAAIAIVIESARNTQRPQPELSVRLTDDAELHQLNNEFRQMDKPTDVLSFGGENYRDGLLIQAPSHFLTPEYLGDIVISMERCAAQARKGGHALEDELTLLVVHGVLHLLGYDHATKKRKALMWAAQAKALAQLGVKIKVR